MDQELEINVLHYISFSPPKIKPKFCNDPLRIKLNVPIEIIKNSIIFLLL